MSRSSAILLAAFSSMFLAACPPPAPPVDEPLKADPPLTDPTPPKKKGNPELDRGVAFIKASKFKEAEEHLKAAIEFDPKNPEAHYYMGVVLDQTGGDLAKAEEHYKTALSLDPAFVDASVNLAAIYLTDPARPDLALPLLNDALKKSPNDPVLLTNLGYAHFLKKDTDKAVAAYESALKVQESADTRLQLGILLFEGGKAEAAVPHLLKAAAARNDDAQSLATIARMLGPGKAFGDCVRLLDRVIELKKADPEVLVRRGVCQHSLKKEKEAAADFNAAIKLDPKFQAAYFYLGQSMLEVKNKPAAKINFKKAYDLGKDTAIGKKAKQEHDAITK